MLRLAQQKSTKLFCIILIITSLIVYRCIRQPQVISEALCIFDMAHSLLLRPNQQIHDSVLMRSIILGVGQVIVDGVGIITFLLWLFKIKNFRLPIAIALFFGVRTIFLAYQRFPYPFPDTVVWINPGFPSLFVLYQKTRDFFYSGHTGTMTILTCQLFKRKNIAMGIVSLIGLLYVIMMLLVTHGHYSADIFTGLVFSLLCFQIVDNNLKIVDCILSLPYTAVKCLMMKCGESKRLVCQQTLQNAVKE